MIPIDTQPINMDIMVPTEEVLLKKLTKVIKSFQ